MLVLIIKSAEEMGSNIHFNSFIFKFMYVCLSQIDLGSNPILSCFLAGDHGDTLDISSLQFSHSNCAKII